MIRSAKRKQHQQQALIPSREDGVSCIAVPVFAASGHPVAAVSVSGPAGRIREKLEQHPKEDVLETAARLTEEMK